MIHPMPPLPGEDLLLDDEDVILLTDEIQPAERHDPVEIFQLADRSETQEVLKLSETEKEKEALIDLSDVIEVTDFKSDMPPDLSLTETELLNFDLEDPHAPDAFDQKRRNSTAEAIASFDGLRQEVGAPTEKPSAAAAAPPETEFQIDDLQRLIDEVVHDSHVPPQDFSGTPPVISVPKDSPITEGNVNSLSQNQIDAALERVIRNLFTERILNTLDEVITTMVNREIETIKTILINHLTSGKSIHNDKP